jgi:hypothetical protein
VAFSRLMTLRMYTVPALAAPYRNVTAVAAVAVTLSFSVLTYRCLERFRRSWSASAGGYMTSWWTRPIGSSPINGTSNE